MESLNDNASTTSSSNHVSQPHSTLTQFSIFHGHDQSPQSSDNSLNAITQKIIDMIDSHLESNNTESMAMKA